MYTPSEEMQNAGQEMITKFENVLEEFKKKYKFSEKELFNITHMVLQGTVTCFIVSNLQKKQIANYLSVFFDDLTRNIELNMNANKRELQ